MPQPISAGNSQVQRKSLSTIFDHINSRASAWMILISVSRTDGKWVFALDLVFCIANSLSFLVPGES
ncbi:MAG TPA: hypothetical protein DCS89_15965 [Gammaproteobacteria bacterium]|nr:hypothetical protein [Gammaproteobacteria bacterium]HAT28514.1 hypothetical protein [Gammaproteobacteria bacterium]